MNRQWQTADILNYDILKENAKTNRKNMTEAESAFWTIARGNAFSQRCLRQHIIGDYIVDFLFRKSKLIVEIDGGYHFTNEQKKEDSIRQEWLEHQGYRVIRFTNEEILFDTNRVIECIKETLHDPPCLGRETTSRRETHPSPPCLGRETTSRSDK